MATAGDEYHPPVEEYLTTIYELAEDGVTVIQARLVERLGFSAPAVWEMVGRLKAKGYLTVDGRRSRSARSAARWRSGSSASIGWPSVCSPTSSDFRGTRRTSKLAGGNT